MPQFWECGFSRQDVLKMKHWEVELFRKMYPRKQARDLLALTDALVLGTGWAETDTIKKITDRLMIQAGYKKKVVAHNWLSELQFFAKG